MENNIRKTRPERKRKTQKKLKMCKVIDNQFLIISLLLVINEFCLDIMGEKRESMQMLGVLFVVIVIWGVLNYIMADLTRQLRAIKKAERRER